MASAQFGTDDQHVETRAEAERLQHEIGIEPRRIGHHPAPNAGGLGPGEKIKKSAGGLERLDEVPVGRFLAVHDRIVLVDGHMGQELGGDRRIGLADDPAAIGVPVHRHAMRREAGVESLEMQVVGFGERAVEVEKQRGGHGMG